MNPCICSSFSLTHGLQEDGRALHDAYLVLEISLCSN